MRRLLRISCGVLGLAVVASSLAAAGPGGQAFRPDDLLALTDVSAITVAADGAAVAVSIGRPDVATDTRGDELHVLTRAGKEVNAPHVLRGVSFPTWSTDGRRLHFVSGHDGRAEIRDLDRNSGATRTLAKLPFAPNALTWSPSQTRVAFIAAVPAERHPWLMPRDLAGPTQKPAVIDHVFFRGDEGTLLPATEPRLFVLELASGVSREIELPQGVSLSETEGGDGGVPAWSADEQAVIVSVARGFDDKNTLWNVNRDLLQIHVADGTVAWLAEAPGVESDPAVSPDGRYLAYRRQRGAPQATVFHRDLVIQDMKTKRELMAWTAHDREVERFVWASDGQLLARYIDRGHLVLSRISVQGGEKRLSEDVAMYSALTQPTPAGVVAFVRSRVDLPPEGVTLDRAGRLTEWTAFNTAIRSRALSVASDLDYRSANVDGRMIHAIVARPRNVADTISLPVVVDLHGGPYSARTFNFDAPREYFISQGYVVIQPNYRGSLGYGSAFSQLSDRKQYPGAYDEPNAPSEMGMDVAGVLAAIAEQRLGDPHRVFLRGVSAGALLTSWTIGRTQGFRAAVANSWYPGEFDGASYGSYQIRRYFNGPPWDPAHQSEYWKRQPLMLADRIVTPLLILQGDRDWITPLGEAEKFYYALRSRGLDTVLAIFPDEIHGLERHPASQRTSLSMEVSWFQHHDRAQE